MVSEEISLNKSLIKFSFCICIIMLDPYFNIWRSHLNRKYYRDAEIEQKVALSGK